MKRLLILAVLLCGTGASAQNIPQGDAMREAYKLAGLGVVGRTIAGETACYLNAAGSSAADLLESPDGPAVARLEWRRGQYGGCSAFLVRDGRSEQLYRDWDFVEIEYESAAVVYYEERGEFARVFARGAQPGLWLRIADLPDGRLRRWTEIIAATPRNYRGYEGLALHAQPSEDSTVQTVLREARAHDSRVHEIVPTGEISGAWGEFDVIEWSSDFDIMSRSEEPTQTGNRWQGWLRLVNAEGEPELWFATRD
jgi:hypothetical protein